MTKKKAKKKATKSGKSATTTATGEAAVHERVAAMPERFRATGERIHALIVRTAPALQPTAWYGMPAYAKDRETVCFFRADKKYRTFGFTQQANMTSRGARHQLIESVWYFTALDDATKAKLSAIARRVTN
jgi:hypothetical protein